MPKVLVHSANSTQNIHLHCAAIRPVHFDVRDHATADGTLFGSEAVALDLVAQAEHVIDALFQFSLPTGLSFTNVPSEISIGDSLYSLRQSNELLGPLRVVLPDAFVRAAFLMSAQQNR